MANKSCRTASKIPHAALSLSRTPPSSITKIALKRILESCRGADGASEHQSWHLGTRRLLSKRAHETHSCATGNNSIERVPQVRKMTAERATGGRNFAIAIKAEFKAPSLLVLLSRRACSRFINLIVT